MVGGTDRLDLSKLWRGIVTVHFVTSRDGQCVGYWQPEKMSLHGSQRVLAVRLRRGRERLF
jgi:hypothetical protein